jgi:lipopolysaccharide transport system ATP-binding protein
MSKVIKVENLSKAYQLGQFSTGTLSADIHRWWSLKRGREDPYLKIGETNDRSVKGSSDIVWSLKDINFEIEQGSAVGIIGKNGAGKSTLLKVLSQITSPTTGSVKVKGRIASLLEVGTGFHPELTGRENIFLNGAILGMRKREITSKFDEIVDFAGVERYIDTPVKRYSSGMYVRLAFAVAAHLESEILIVDEVLAVGDAEFQKKCLGKMGDISKGEGRTILFVSHNMASINQLCSEAILLENGFVNMRGPANGVIQKYLSSNVAESTFIDFSHIEVERSEQFVIVNRMWISDSSKIQRRVFMLGETVIFNFELSAPSEIDVSTVQMAVHIATSDGIDICHLVDKDSGYKIQPFNRSIIISVTLTDLRLYPNLYYLSFWVGSLLGDENYHSAEDCLSFEISGGGLLTTRDLPRNSGLIFLTPEWKIDSKMNV